MGYCSDVLFVFCLQISVLHTVLLSGCPHTLSSHDWLLKQLPANAEQAVQFGVPLFVMWLAAGRRCGTKKPMFNKQDSASSEGDEKGWDGWFLWLWWTRWLPWWFLCFYLYPRYEEKLEISWSRPMHIGKKKCFMVEDGCFMKSCRKCNHMEISASLHNTPNCVECFGRFLWVIVMLKFPGLGSPESWSQAEWHQFLMVLLSQ